jgi:endonuclease/exonuclease/phosphatase family metal-dependent hydrolase
MLTYTIV